MAMKLCGSIILLTLVALGEVAFKGIDAASYTVGDSVGWTDNIPNSTFYTNWASKYTFSLGDTLFFNFSTGSHDVGMVDSAAYTSCSTANPMATYNTGPATVQLNTTGTHYYMCLFNGHCSQGQKFSINVQGSGSSAPTGSPSTNLSPPPPSTRSAQGPSGSSAASFSVKFGLMLMSIAIGLFVCT